MKMKALQIICFIAIFVSGIFVGYFVKIDDQQKEIIKYLESTGSIFYDSILLMETHTLLQVAKEYEESNEAGNDFLKRILYIRYSARNGGEKSISRKYLDLLNSDEIYAFLVKNPIKPCKEVAKDHILECYKENYSSK